MAGVYWLGADGNIYWKYGPAADDVRNMGQPINYDQGATNWDQGADTTVASFEATRIADPNPPQTNYTSGGSSAPAPVLDQAAIDATQQAVNALGTKLDTGYGNIDRSYGSLIGGYDREAQRNEADYGENVVTNNTNLQKNKQNALVAAAQGRRGLRGVLSSIGALFGSGGRLADRAVTSEANQDIGGATDTAAENSRQLDTAIGRFREDDKNRRAEAETAKTNQRTRLEGDVAADRQKLYKQMADIYKEGGNTDAAATWLRRAGDLNDYIASHTAVAQTPFSKLAAVYTPGTLENYLAGAGDMTVQVAPAAGGVAIPGTTLLAGRRKRDREDTLVPAVA